MKLIYEFKPLPNSGCPITSGGDLTTPNFDIVETVGNVYSQAGLRVGGANSQGAAKTAGGSIYLPYSAFDKYLFCSLMKVPEAESQVNTIAMELLHYDGTNLKQNRLQANFNAGVDSQYEYFDENLAYVALSALDAVFPDSNGWINWGFVMDLETPTYESVNIQDQQVLGLTGPSAANVGEPKVVLRFWINLPDSTTSHFILGYCSLFGL